MAGLFHLVALVCVCSSLAVRTSSGDTELGGTGATPSEPVAMIMTSELSEHFPVVSEQSKKCLDYDTTSGDVVTADCSGSDTQQWILQPDTEVLQPKGDYSRCIHYDITDNAGRVKLWDCRYSSNQKWYWDGQRVRSRFGFRAYCMDEERKSNNVFMRRCNDFESQKWVNAQATATTTTTTPKPPAHIKTTYDEACMDYDNRTSRVFMADCTDSATQLWYRDGPSLKSKNDPFSCLHFDLSSWSADKVKMHPCTFSRNQRWLHESGKLRTEYGKKKCLEYDTSSKDVLMKKCTDNSKTQEWIAIRE